MIFCFSKSKDTLRKLEPSSILKIIPVGKFPGGLIRKKIKNKRNVATKNIYNGDLFGICYIGKFVGGEASLDSMRSKVGTFNIWPGKCHRVASSSVFKTKVLE